MEWGTALGSGVVVALITSSFLKLSADKKVRIENITKERKAWRDRMRELVLHANAAFHKRDSTKLSMIEAELVVRLNPGDDNDKQIVESIRKLRIGWNDQTFLVQFNDRMALLLKHDWERAKVEASGTPSPQTLGITAIVLTFALALIVYLVKCGYAKITPACVLVTGMVLVVVALFGSFGIHLIYEYDKKHWRTRSIAWFRSKPQRDPYP